MSKKKIIFIANNNIGPGFSGGDRIFVEFLKNWSKSAGITLIGSEEAIKMSKEREVVGVKFVQSDSIYRKDNFFAFSSLIQNLTRRSRRGLQAVRKLRSQVKTSDIVYSVSDFYPDFLPGFYAKLLNKKITWIAGYYLFAPKPGAKDSPYKGKDAIRGFFYWLMQRPSFWLVRKYADIVFVTSEPDVEKFITQKRDRSKIIVVQGGVDITESERYLKSGKIVPVEDRKYDACFVGRFHFQKGVVGLVDIWKLVCDKLPGAKLLMIGDGELGHEVKQKVKKLGLTQNIDFPGFADGEKKFSFFKQSKVMVHPATYDSGGMAAAEGMAWGLPGVSYDLEALKTYYPKGMVKSKLDDQKDFASNILELLSDKKYYQQISTDARDLIVNVWDWSKRASQIYQRVMELTGNELK